MLSFASSFLLIAVAELGDKTQLLALSFAAKYKPLKVIAGVFTATLLVSLFSAALGGFISHFIPFKILKIIVGFSFISFGIWALKEEAGTEAKIKSEFRLGPVLTVAIAFFLAELGDKTQLATVSLAAQYTKLIDFTGVWLGATLGMVAADSIAIVAGVIMGKKLPERAIRYICAAIFIFFGILTIAQSFNL